MHDHSLGGPVDVGVQEDTNHKGPCNDGVYGCTRCHDNANDGKGTIGKCEWCGKDNEYLKITPASDEPCSYAVCEACRKKQAIRLQQEAEEFYNDCEGEDYYYEDYHRD